MLIIVFLNNLFKLYYYQNIVHSDIIIIDDIKYTVDLNSKKNQGFIGFFDWLRTGESLITGIRLCFFVHQPYNNYLFKLPYLIPTFDNKCFELFFNGDKYDPAISGDQDFSNNYVYESINGNYLFTFGLDHLKSEEILSLKKHCLLLNEMNFNLHKPQ